MEQIKEKNRDCISDQLYFVTAKASSPEIVLNANKVRAYVPPTNKSNILTAANIIKNDILQYCSEQTKPA